MIDVVHAVILGIVQGATEFLPVSSSGHLALGQRLLSVESLPEAPLLLEILLHLATLLAVIGVFRRDIAALLLAAGRVCRSVVRPDRRETLREDESVRMLWLLIAGTVPTGILGVLFSSSGIAAAVARTPLFLGIAFLSTAGILLLTRSVSEQSRSVTLRLALLIGLAQGIAVLPGISRSGITIAVAMLLGIHRREAARFSFLLSLPAILGATVLELDWTVLAQTRPLLPLLVGALAALVTGYVALRLLLGMVQAGRLWYFSPYVASVGILTLWLL